MRKVFYVTSILLLADTMVQLYLAAIGVFSNPADELFGWHAINGQIVLRALALLMIVFAAVARAGNGTIWMAVTLFLLTWLQLVFFILAGVIWGLGPDNHANPPLPATLFVSLHGLNGSIIIVLSVVLVFRARKLSKEPMPPKRRATAAASPAPEAGEAEPSASAIR